jgi:hypothetical protein
VLKTWIFSNNVRHKFVFSLNELAHFFRLLGDVSKNVVNMDLVDSTFSPFKVKNGTDPTLLPKMKIFLPKTEDDSSRSSSEEDLALKNSN